MLRPVMTLLVGAAFLLGCSSADEAAESKASATEGIDTAAMIAEGAESGQAEPAEDPDHVPVEVSYTARLLHPTPEAVAAGLSPGGQFSASGKGICRWTNVPAHGTWRLPTSIRETS
jgi:hypothetical protein